MTENNPVRVIEAFIDELDLATLGFDGVVPEATGRLAYHPATLLKIYLYGYLNRVQSSRRLEREAQRNIELMWLTGRLAPDFKTIADFRKDNGSGGSSPTPRSPGATPTICRCAPLARSLRRDRRSRGSDTGLPTGTEPRTLGY